MLQDKLGYIHMHPEVYFTQKARNGGYICPICGNGSGQNGTGVNLIKGQSFRYKCFKCGTSGDVINFYAAEHRLSNVKALPGIPIRSEKPFYAPLRARRSQSKITMPPSEENASEDFQIANVISADIVLAAEHLRQTDYFLKRGISYSTAEKYNCGYIEKWIHPKNRGNAEISSSPRVIIPTSVESYVARSTNENDVPKMKAGSANIFNIDILKTSIQNVVIVEGEFDALSIIEAGNDAVALGSVNNIDKFVNWLKKCNVRPKLPLILSLDTDNAGQRAVDRLSNELRDLRIKFYCLNLVIEDCKDQNESLIRYREQFFKMIADIPNQITLLQQQTRYNLTDFSKIDRWERSIRNGRKVISTGWTSLDRVLDGGLYEGLYVVPGTPGTGKTALALQMAFQIAQQNQDVLYISLEMSEEEIYERHISRISYQLFGRDEEKRHMAKTVHSMIQEKQTVSKAREIFTKIAPYLRTECNVESPSTDDIRRLIEEYEYDLNSVSIVFIDYLQILKAHDPHMSDKQAVDYNVLRLKQISRDFKTSVVILSSMNRMSYSDLISMSALKESGAIEYTADVCLGLQLSDIGQIKTGTSSGKAEKSICQMKNKAERDMDIVILKNRNGRVGEELKFLYYAMFHHFAARDDETKMNPFSSAQITSMESFFGIKFDDKSQSQPEKYETLRQRNCQSS